MREWVKAISGLMLRVLAVLLAAAVAAGGALCCAYAAAPEPGDDGLLSYGMLPVYPRDIHDGRYSIEVRSSSQFFRIEEAELTVSGDEMEAVITLSSTSYSYVYPGTAEEAAAADKADWIPAEESGGRGSFRMNVDSLDSRVKCAAYSKRKSKWYDRDLVFLASSLPADTLYIELPDYELIDKAVREYEGAAAAPGGSGEAGPADRADGMVGADGKAGSEEDAGVSAEPAAVDLPDGEYSVEVNMTGGSGRASISSPTLLTVRDGKAYATLLWSSANYDYMLIGSTRYENLTTDGGNSTFEIPVAVFDEPFPVTADTTAMGDPVEISYELTLYEDSIGDKGAIPQEAAKKVLAVALVIIAAGGVIDHFVKKKRYN